MLALGILAGAASAEASHASAPLGHLVFSEQAPPPNRAACGRVCDGWLTTVAGDASGEKRLTMYSIDSAPAWSPNGRLIAHWRTLRSGRPGQIQLHVVSPKNDRALLSDVSSDALSGYSPPTWSPTGGSILMTADVVHHSFYGVTASGWAVLAVSLGPHPGINHAKVKRLFRLPGGSDVNWSEIRLSPNGKWLALAWSRSSHDGSTSAALYLVHPNGKGLHRIANASDDPFTSDLHAISWSPDSSRLAYVGTPGDLACGDPNPPPLDLWTVSADGAVKHEVWATTCVSGSWVAPDTIAPRGTTTWSPDGTEILYSTDDFTATSDPNRWGYQFHEANASTGTIEPFPVPAGDCGGGPGSCKLADPQWTTH